MRAKVQVRTLFFYFFFYKYMCLQSIFSIFNMIISQLVKRGVHQLFQTKTGNLIDYTWDYWLHQKAVCQLTQSLNVKLYFVA